MTNAVRVRFAPSPSGALHIGNLRTALFNWLYARGKKGTFVLRIEDSDQSRSDVEAEKTIFESLKTLGLFWDEGPDVGGSFGSYRQSERTSIYKTALLSLDEAGHTYRCFCSPEELEKERKALAIAGKPPRYSGKCRELSKEEGDRLKSEGKAFAKRFRAGTEVISFNDSIRGTVTFNMADIGDFVLARSDGSAIFLLASAVDDMEMKITDVIRGEDHLSNTPKQIVLIEALGGKPPNYHHLPLVMSRHGKKLSKREGGIRISELLGARYLPEAIVTATAMLGWAGISGDKNVSAKELSKIFNLTEVSNSPAKFDLARLKSLNAKALKALPPDKFAELFYPLLEISGFPFGRFGEEKSGSVMKAVQETITTPEEAGLVAMQFAMWHTPDDEAKKVLENRDAKEVVNALKVSLEQIGEWNETTYNAVIKSVTRITGLKGKNLFMPVRVAITGRTSGPRLADLFSILSHDDVVERVEQTKKVLT